VAWRPEHEDHVLRADRGPLRTIVLRPGCVYGGRGGLTGAWFSSAAQNGAARVIGDGRGRWTMVHVADLARAYRLAVESAVRREVFNVSDRSRFSVLECAEAASRAAGAGGRVQTVPLDEATAQMGGFAEALAADQHVDSSKATRMLGWQPRHGGFVDGVERYYLAWKAWAG
jgi:nucleoside-diphosphate-sugar epimerase